MCVGKRHIPKQLKYVTHRFLFFVRNTVSIKIFRIPCPPAPSFRFSSQCIHTPARTQTAPHRTNIDTHTHTRGPFPPYCQLCEMAPHLFPTLGNNPRQNCDRKALPRAFSRSLKLPTPPTSPPMHRNSEGSADNCYSKHFHFLAQTKTPAPFLRCNSKQTGSAPIRMLHTAAGSFMPIKVTQTQSCSPPPNQPHEIYFKTNISQ